MIVLADRNKWTDQRLEYSTFDYPVRTFWECFVNQRGQIGRAFVMDLFAKLLSGFVNLSCQNLLDNHYAEFKLHQLGCDPTDLETRPTVSVNITILISFNTKSKNLNSNSKFKIFNFDNSETRYLGFVMELLLKILTFDYFPTARCSPVKGKLLPALLSVRKGVKNLFTDSVCRRGGGRKIINFWP